jgi:hypothetical protein
MRRRVVDVSLIAMLIAFVSLAAVVKTYSVSGGQLSKSLQEFVLQTLAFREMTFC